MAAVPASALPSAALPIDANEAILSDAEKCRSERSSGADCSELEGSRGAPDDHEDDELIDSFSESLRFTNGGGDQSISNEEGVEPDAAAATNDSDEGSGDKPAPLSAIVKYSIAELLDREARRQARLRCTATYRTLVAAATLAPPLVAAAAVGPAAALTVAGQTADWYALPYAIEFLPHGPVRDAAIRVLVALPWAVAPITTAARLVAGTAASRAAETLRCGEELQAAALFVGGEIGANSRVVRRAQGALRAGAGRAGRKAVARAARLLLLSDVPAADTAAPASSGRALADDVSATATATQTTALPPRADSSELDNDANLRHHRVEHTSFKAAGGAGTTDITDTAAFGASSSTALAASVSALSRHCGSAPSVDLRTALTCAVLARDVYQDWDGPQIPLHESLQQQQAGATASASLSNVSFPNVSLLPSMPAMDAASIANSRYLTDNASGTDFLEFAPVGEGGIAAADVEARRSFSSFLMHSRNTTGPDSPVSNGADAITRDSVEAAIRQRYRIVRVDESQTLGPTALFTSFPAVPLTGLAASACDLPLIGPVLTSVSNAVTLSGTAVASAAVGAVGTVCSSLSSLFYPASADSNAPDGTAPVSDGGSVDNASTPAPQSPSDALSAVAASFSGSSSSQQLMLQPPSSSSSWSLDLSLFKPLASSFELPSDGFRAATYVSEADRMVVVAFRGTHLVPGGHIAGNLIDDLLLLAGKVPSTASRAVDVAADAVRTYGSQGFRVILTGHSLAGVLSVIASAVTGAEAVAFDNPSISATALAEALPALRERAAAHFRDAAATGLLQLRSAGVDGRLLLGGVDGDSRSSGTPFKLSSGSGSSMSRRGPDLSPLALAQALEAEAAQLGRKLDHRLGALSHKLEFDAVQLSHTLDEVVTHTLDEVVTAVETKASLITHKIETAADEVVHSLETAADEVVHSVEATAAQLSHKIDEAAAVVEAKAVDLSHKVDAAVSQVEAKVESAVAKVAGLKDEAAERLRAKVLLELELARRRLPVAGAAGGDDPFSPFLSGAGTGGDARGGSGSGGDSTGSPAALSLVAAALSGKLNATSYQGQPNVMNGLGPSNGIRAGQGRLVTLPPCRSVNETVDEVKAAWSRFVGDVSSSSSSSGSNSSNSKPSPLSAPPPLALASGGILTSLLGLLPWRLRLSVWSSPQPAASSSSPSISSSSGTATIASALSVDAPSSGSTAAAGIGALAAADALDLAADAAPVITSSAAPPDRFAADIVASGALAAVAADVSASVSPSSSPSATPASFSVSAPPPLDPGTPLGAAASALLASVASEWRKHSIMGLQDAITELVAQAAAEALASTAAAHAGGAKGEGGGVRRP